MPPDVSIITPWLDHPEFIPDYEAAVSSAGVEVIVVDNGSAAANASLLREMIGRVGGRYIRNEENRWFSAANNQGLEVAAGSIILFLNNDIAAQAGWIDRVRADVKDGGLFGPTIAHTVVEQQTISYLEGWCIAGLRRVWDHLGGWDAQAFKMPYWEDVALSLRAARAGIGLHRALWPLAHKKNGTSGHLWATDHSLAHNRQVFLALLRGQTPLSAEESPELIHVPQPLINFLQTGRLTEAERAYRQALTHEPQRADLWMEYARVLRACGRFEASIQAGARAMELHPPFAADAHAEIAMALSNEGKHGDAADSFARAVRLQPPDARMLTNLSTELCLARRFSEAIEAANQAMAVDPAHAGAFVQLANALLGLGRLEEALAAARSAVSLAPASASSQRVLGATYRALGRISDARAAYEEACRLEPLNSDIIAERAAMLRGERGSAQN